jgi:CelD/BcsL family acetyltransferase involved in cellulose biosynthesis
MKRDKTNQRRPHKTDSANVTCHHNESPACVKGRQGLNFTMLHVSEINHIDQLLPLRRAWDALLEKTPGASFFQSLDWLEVYWRHFGDELKLRTLVVWDADDRPAGIVPLVVRRERSKVGRFRVLGFPLHDWGSFYGPIGPDPRRTLAAGLEHIRQMSRDWDALELRWQGAVGTDPADTQRAMLAAGFQAYRTLWNRTAVVDLEGTWDAYWATRKGAWLRRFRHDQRKLAQQGVVAFERYRPAGLALADGEPRWDLYDACEDLARRSWQGAANDGTTLSHESVRGFLRDVHEAAARAGAVDLSLLRLDGTPAAFIYGYHYRGYVYGLRRGYDARRTQQGAGNALLAYAIRDSFARGDHVYDMGVGSLETKRHFWTRLVPILRYSHFPPPIPRMQILRLRRWWQSRRCAI